MRRYSTRSQAADIVHYNNTTTSPAPVPACSTPGPNTSIPAPLSSAPSTLPSSPSTPDDSSLSPTLSDDLTVENKLLMEKIADLNRRVTGLLDQSIESYSSGHMTAPRAAMTVDCVTPCEPSISLDYPDDTVVTVNACVQYEYLAIRLSRYMSVFDCSYLIEFRQVNVKYNVWTRETIQYFRNNHPNYSGTHCQALEEN
ncbi:hypothetical protein J6590_092985 [Homalodisca vitripennis]|nr:hypothetical protein J6590_089158 [Homalodisca vitripennis]KAG8285067.1 hypothetical protein J6590_088632 [Homalodisca vitripennis]KAG8324405.1 hypothetical protein J6590_092985 [Homalodisca vitripennis]